MLKSAEYPGGLPIETFDAIRTGVASDRAQFYRDLSIPFYGANRAGSSLSQGVRDAFWSQCMSCGLKAAYDCIEEFSASVFTDDLRRFDVPTLIIHGDDDQIVPIDNSARLSADLIPEAQLIVYERGSHGLPVTQRERFNADLLAFARS
jgi:non-heme chloroperoxidase